MIYTRPFITKRFIAYAGDSRTTEVSLAVRAIDAFTDEPPLVPLSVRLKQLSEIRPLRGESGFYCFEGRHLDGTDVLRTPIPNGNYQLIVEPDPTLRHLYNLQPKPGDPWTTTFERDVTIPVTGPLSPLEIVTLSPTPAYPFSANATLVRGKVSKAGTEVAAAVVSTTYEQTDPDDPTQTKFVDIETITDRAGEYVLFFKGLPAKTQSRPIHAEKNGDQDDITVLITEGETLTNQDISFP